MAQIPASDPTNSAGKLGSSKLGSSGKADKSVKKARRGSAWNAFSAGISASSSSAANKTQEKDAEPAYTLYVSTPTHNLTLTRTTAQIVALDEKLRENHPAAVNSKTLPALPPLQSAAASAAASRSSVASPAAQQQTSSRKLLQTISRTLSPASNKTRTALGNLAAPNLGLSDSQQSISSAASSSSANGLTPVSEKEKKSVEMTPSSSTAASAGSATNNNGTPTSSAVEKGINNLTALPESVASPPLTPNADGTIKLTSSHATTIHIATYLTTVANLAFIRKDAAWKRFVRVEADDLQSVRVERRIKKVRSDLAKHVKSNVAPRNININIDVHDPSQSDLGEDGTRTDDDRNSVISGRSRDGHASAVSSVEAFHGAGASAGAAVSGLAVGSAAAIAAAKRRSAGVSSSTNLEAPDVPARSTSVDSERASTTPSAAQQQQQQQQNGAGAGASSRSFVSIPEEAERENAAAANEQDSQGLDQSLDSTAVSQDSSRKKDRRQSERRKGSDKVTVEDFEMIRVLGKGCAGKVSTFVVCKGLSHANLHSFLLQVLLVRHTPTKGLFAMKSIHKRHVLAHQELQHTLTEQSVLKRMSREANEPFVVKLWWSFHDKHNLYLVMDFHPGGDLATQLSRWGRLGRDRARFYAAEIVEGVEGLHRAGVIYRDLKPENVLIGSDGHIVLSDFGLSKEFPRDTEEGNAGPTSGRSTPPGSPQRSHSSNNIKAKPPHWMGGQDDSSTGRNRGSGGLTTWKEQRDTTTTFCGTAEYLAPEVIQGAAYSYEVDWWSFGTMLYEMLTGITPFWADTHADMYVRVLHDELVFPEDRVLDTDTKSILRGLLQRNPILRMKEPRIKKHPYFSMIEWAHVFHKRYIPPYVPPINPLDETDTQNFDEAFLDMQPTVTNAVEEDAAEEEIAAQAEAEKATRLVQERAEADAHANGQTIDAEVKSLFDGYSYRGRRDSESVKSTVMSASSDSQPTNEPAASEASTGADRAPPAATKVDTTAATATRPADEESEDEEAAARAAVAALARLEREASAELTTNSSPSARSSSTRPTSATLSRDAASSATSDDDHSIVGAGVGKTKSSRAGAPSHEDIVETDDEDEDWDMIDGIEMLRSEVNGGKGQNLFARGVVDTYRLLRRQEPTRQPSSPGAKALNRLSRRQGSSSERNRSSQKKSGALRSPSPNSLSSDNNVTSVPSRDSASKALPSLPAAQEEDGDARMADSESKTSAALTTSASAASKSDARKSRRGNPSLGSSDDLHTSEKAKQPKKRMKRFTT